MRPDDEYGTLHVERLLFRTCVSSLMEVSSIEFATVTGSSVHAADYLQNICLFYSVIHHPLVRISPVTIMSVFHCPPSHPPAILLIVLMLLAGFSSVVVGLATVLVTLFGMSTAEPSGTSCSTPQTSGIAGANDPFWMETIQRQGRAAFNSNPSSYQVFRNVKDFGAKGDGVTDDTAAIKNVVSTKL